MKNSHHETQADFNPPPLSILQRLDRLDRLKKHRVKVKVEGEEDEYCKCFFLYSSASALQQALQKGTVMERLAHLETRFLQLSLDMEMGNMTSVTSTSSTAPHLKLNGMITIPGRMVVVNPEEDCSLNNSECGRKRVTIKKGYYRKCLKYFQLGCSCSS